MRSGETCLSRRGACGRLLAAACILLLAFAMLRPTLVGRAQAQVQPEQPAAHTLQADVLDRTAAVEAQARPAKRIEAGDMRGPFALAPADGWRALAWEVVRLAEPADRPPVRNAAGGRLARGPPTA